MNSLKTSETGFTVLETLIVVFMVGLMAAIAIPSYLALISKTINSAIIRVIEEEIKNCQKYRAPGNGCAVYIIQTSEEVAMATDEYLPELQPNGGGLLARSEHLQELELKPIRIQNPFRHFFPPYVSVSSHTNAVVSNENLRASAIIFDEEGQLVSGGFNVVVTNKNGKPDPKNTQCLYSEFEYTQSASPPPFFRLEAADLLRRCHKPTSIIFRY